MFSKLMEMGRLSRSGVAKMMEDGTLKEALKVKPFWVAGEKEDEAEKEKGRWTFSC